MEELTTLALRIAQLAELLLRGWRWLSGRRRDSADP